jgi:hypothetical protein
MRAALRLLVVTLVAGLAVGVGSASAAMIGPSFSTSPFTIAQPGVGNTVTMNLIWEATQFLPPTAMDKQTVTYQDLAGGSPQTFSASSTQTSIPLLLQNGHRYTLTVSGCQVAACTIGAFDTLSVAQTTTIDATGPAGTVQVNGGAAFTNNPKVTLNVAATDPLIDGLPDTSSGVTQAAVDVDGNGTIPCDIIFGQNPDTTGCAQPFVPALTANLPAGDGPKKVGVYFGDGARQNTRPCPTIFCAILLGSPILGNASAEAFDEIGLDTAKPIALATQDRFTIDRGETVRFDSSTSIDQNPATASGVDPASATWQFKDGTPQATGSKVAHVFNRAGTFVGELRVRDRAGNVSDVRQFAVTVIGPATTAGTLKGITGTAAFNLDRLSVKAKYVRSRLRGSVIMAGSAAQAGALRAEIRRTARGKVLGRVASKALKVGAFTRTLKLPPTLLPGTYRLSFVGPGGTLSTTLTLKPPREGVIRSARVNSSGVTFRMAAQPVKALRGKLTIAWFKGSRSVTTVAVSSGATIRAATPRGATIGSGRIKAVLKAGGTVVGSATTR